MEMSNDEYRQRYLQINREAAEAILADPNADPLTKDLARCSLQDAQELNDVTPQPYQVENKFYRTMTNDWVQVEAYERGISPASSLSKPELIHLAAKTFRDGEMTHLHSIPGPDGKQRPILAYPQLVGACRGAIAANPQSPLSTEAHTVLGSLNIMTSTQEAIEHFKHAIAIQPDDWKLRDMLATAYMKSNLPSLALEQLTIAEQNAPSFRIRFGLSTNKGKTLFNLQQDAEAKACLEQVMADSEQFKEELTEKQRGRLAVAQYMLVVLYAKDRNKALVKQHWEDAEAKRRGLSPLALADIDWDARVLAQAVATQVDPDLLANRECNCCHKTTSNYQRCSACKRAYYCSKECQVKAWKAGHKAECKNLNADRKDQKRERKHQLKKDAATASMEPLDAKLDPSKLWAEGNRLAHNKQTAFQAVFYFAVALFMDFSLDANDMKLARKAVKECSSSCKNNTDGDPLVIALSMVAHLDLRKPLQKCIEGYEKVVAILSKNTSLPIAAPETSESFEDIDRFAFGVAMSFVFHARILGRCYAVGSMQQAQNPKYKETFQEISKLVMEAKPYLDYRRWLTIQYEFGYTNFDVGACKESKIWLSLFVKNLEDLQKANAGNLSNHWLRMLQNAKQKLQMIPLMEMAHQAGFML